MCDRKEKIEKTVHNLMTSDQRVVVAADSCCDLVREAEGHVSGTRMQWLMLLLMLRLMHQQNRVKKHHQASIYGREAIQREGREKMRH